MVLTYIKGVAIVRNFTLGLPYNALLKERAKKLRKAGVMSEVVFWMQVRNKGFYGIDFDRQRIIGNYIVDFYIKSLSVVIEIDGSSHNEKDIYDAKRDDFFKQLGLRIYHIPESRVMHDLNNVMLELENYILEEFGSKN